MSAARLALRLTLTLAAPPAALASLAAQHVDRRMAVDPHASIRILDLAGAIHVSGWDRDSVTVTGTVPRGAGRFYAGGSRAGIKLGVESDSLGAPGVDLDIRVPRGATVWIKSSSATVELTGVEGDVDIATVSGDIRAEGAPRRISAEAMDGDIELTTRAAITRAKTAGGSITITGGGGDVTAASVSGAVRYTGAHKLLVGRLESVTGSVTFEGTVIRGGTLAIETHDGPVEVRVPPGQATRFELTSFGGAVTNALAGTEPVVPKGKPVRFTNGEGNAGAASVTVRTFKGNVRIGGT